MNGHKSDTGAMSLENVDINNVHPKTVNNEHFFLVTMDEKGIEEEAVFLSHGFILSIDTIPLERKRGR